jgi:hypothetical protein
MSEKRPWAVFVYLVADDQRASTAASLDNVAEGELDLMFEAVDPSSMHLAVQVDFRSKKRVWRYLEREPEGNLPESSASDPRTIKRFLDWAYQKAPAERYLILFWGHAFGTAGLFPDSRPDAPFSSDLLSLTELGSVLSHASMLSGGQAVDIVMFKNCCLSNVETAYELRDSAEFMIASQARLPARGWPYQSLFNALAAPRGTDASTEQVSLRLVQRLAKHYADTLPARDVPVTLLRLSAAGQLREPMTALSLDLADARGTVRWASTVEDALRQAAFLGDPAMPDVVNLCRNLRDPRGPYSRSLAEAAQTVEHVVNRRLVLSHFSKTSAFNGLGIFYRSQETVARESSIVANAADLSEYVRLGFCRDTNWSEIALGFDFSNSHTLNRPAELTAASWR